MGFAAGGVAAGPTPRCCARYYRVVAILTGDLNSASSGRS
jgi:hypothetical protein